nr:MAG TPA: hypothetical protein [Caudoviricetes sp.]DAU57114.1 MAG TPA: hypothetical protein [Caudoviricetes sp.]
MCIIKLQVAQDIAKVKEKNSVLYYIGHAFNIEYFAQFVNEKRNILRKNKGGAKCQFIQI